MDKEVEMREAVKLGRERIRKMNLLKEAVAKGVDRKAHEADLAEDKIISDRFNGVVKEVDQKIINGKPVVVVKRFNLRKC